MPKIIPEAKARIIASAKNILLHNEYEGFNLRDVASQCRVAVGTIYNYFPGKVDLVAAIMAEDWFCALAAMEKGCNCAESVGEGVRSIHDAIVNFVRIYEPIWLGYSEMPKGFDRRHVMLRDQLADILAKLLTRFHHYEDEDLYKLAAEMILTTARSQDISFDALSELIERLFK